MQSLFGKSSEKLEIKLVFNVLSIANQRFPTLFEKQFASTFGCAEYNSLVEAGNGFGKCAENQASVAQLVEQLICNQLVGGSSPSTGSMPKG